MSNSAQVGQVQINLSPSLLLSYAKKGENNLLNCANFHKMTKNYHKDEIHQPLCNETKKKYCQTKKLKSNVKERYFVICSYLGQQVMRYSTAPMASALLCFTLFFCLSIDMKCFFFGQDKICCDLSMLFLS